MISVQHQPWSAKLLWLIIPSVLGAGLWWFIVARTLRGEVAFTTADLATLAAFIIFGIFAFGLWLASLGLLAYVGPRRTIHLLAAAIATLPVLLFFPLSAWTALAGAITWLALWWGVERMHGDIQNRLHVRPHLTLAPAFAISTLLIMAAVSLLYYQQLRGSERSSIELATRLSDQTVRLTERFLPLIYREYRPNMTVDQLINANFPTAEQILRDVNFDNLSSLNQQETEIRDRLTQLGLDPDEFNVDSQATKSQILAALDQQLAAQRRQGIAEVRQSIGDQFGITLEADEPVRHVITKIINRQFDRYVARYVAIVPWLLAAALFFVLRVFNGLFLLSLTWIGWLLYRLYRALHIVKIEHEMVPAEKLEWDR